MSGFSAAVDRLTVGPGPLARHRRQVGRAAGASSRSSAPPRRPSSSPRRSARPRTRSAIARSASTSPRPSSPSARSAATRGAIQASSAWSSNRATCWPWRRPATFQGVYHVLLGRLAPLPGHGARAVDRRCPRGSRPVGHRPRADHGHQPQPRRGRHCASHRRNGCTTAPCESPGWPAAWPPGARSSSPTGTCSPTPSPADSRSEPLIRSFDNASCSLVLRRHSLVRRTEIVLDASDDRGIEFAGRVGLCDEGGSTLSRSPAASPRDGTEDWLMRLDTSQQMRTEMRLRMAPRMIQSMEILQLPIMALQERIEQELSENPVLVDLRESPAPAEGENEETGTPRRRRARSRGARRVRQPDRPRRELERALRRRAPAEPGLAQRGGRSQAGRDAEHGLAAPLVPRRSEPISSASSTAIRPSAQLAEYIIYNLDDNGYLQAQTCTTWSATSTARPRSEQAEEALAAGPEARPAGVGARDLRECLLLQLTPETPSHDVLRTLISQPSRRSPAQPAAGHREEDRASRSRRSRRHSSTSGGSIPGRAHRSRPTTAPSTSCPT